MRFPLYSIAMVAAGIFMGVGNYNCTNEFIKWIDYVYSWNNLFAWAYKGR